MTDILESLRRASMRSPHRTGLTRLLGKTDSFGVPGRYSLAFTGDGRFVQSEESPLGSRIGFDGQLGWTVDWSGMPRRLQHRDLDLAQLVNWVQSAFWFEKNCPLEIDEVDPRNRAHERPVLNLRPVEGLMEIELTLDRETMDPHSLRRTGIAGLETWTFEDYRESEGRRFASRISSYLGDHLTKVIAVERFENIEEVPRGFAAAQTSLPSDFHFDGSRSGTVEMRRAPSGHIIVPAQLNGGDRDWFIFDSGAGQSVITPERAGELDLDRVGTVMGASASATWPTAVYRAYQIGVGPLTIDHPLLVEMNLSPLESALGVKVAGIIGYDVLSRAIVEVDPIADQLVFSDPLGYELQGAEWQELVIHNRHPHIAARFEGDRSGLFKLDIGAGGGPWGNVIFHTPAVKQWDLLRDREVTDSSYAELKVGIGEIEWFEIGGHRFGPTRVVFAREGAGPFTDIYTSGNIGIGLLQNFRIVFDYPRERISLLPVKRKDSDRGSGENH